MGVGVLHAPPLHPGVGVLVGQVLGVQPGVAVAVAGGGAVAVTVAQFGVLQGVDVGVGQAPALQPGVGVTDGQLAGLQPGVGVAVGH